MVWLALVGCGWLSGPKVAVHEAKEAFEAGDLERFEAVVDVDAVAPVVYDTCLAFVRDSRLDEQLFRFRPAVEGLLSGLEVWLTDAVTEEHGGAASAFREGFPSLSPERCRGLEGRLDQATFARAGGNRATAIVPVRVAGELDLVWTVDLEKDERWRIVGLDVGDSVQMHRDFQLDKAHVTALGLASGLADGAPHDDWEAVRHYTGNRPQDAEVARLYEAALAPLLEHSAPLTPQRVAMVRPQGLFRLRHAGARVVNPTDREVASYVLRFSFRDFNDQRILSAAGQQDLLTTGGPLLPRGHGEVQVRAGGWAWPGAARVEAQVVEAVWADGTVWTHPAVLAGAWSTL